MFDSRARAQAAIADGAISVNGTPARKPSQKVQADDEIRLSDMHHDYVSRGALKLLAALDHFHLDPDQKTCLDLGASTGGFCDVLLRRGAAHIYAVDVGHGQLHRRIAADPRVTNLEKTHAKDLTPKLIQAAPALIVCDVSFISLTKALPFALQLAAPKANVVALIKPQFEVGRAALGKGGLVADELAYQTAQDLAAWLGAQPDWSVNGVIPCPIRGGDGNQEYLLSGTKA